MKYLCSYLSYYDLHLIYNIVCLRINDLRDIQLKLLGDKLNLNDYFNSINQEITYLENIQDSLFKYFCDYNIEYRDEE